MSAQSIVFFLLLLRDVRKREYYQVGKNRDQKCRAQQCKVYRNRFADTFYFMSSVYGNDEAPSL